MRNARWLLVALAALPLAILSAEPSTLHREKTLQAKPGGTLKVEASFQDVVVSVRPGSTVDVTVDVKASGWPGNQDEFVKSCEPQYSEAGDTVAITCKPSTHMTGWQNLEGKIAVKMPPGMALSVSCGSGDCSLAGDIGAFAAGLHTGSGDITVQGACKAITTESGSGDVKVSLSSSADKAEMSAGSGDITLVGSVLELSIETGSGDVTARLGQPAEKASLRTGSGDIVLKGGARQLSAHTGSGQIQAEGLAGGAKLHSSSGDIVAAWSKPPQGEKVTAESSSGNVQLTFPASAVFSGVLETSSGNISCDFPGTLKKNDRTFTLAGSQGAAGLDVETGSGDIHVRSAK